MQTLTDTLNNNNWHIANMNLVKKIITEFLYEEMLVTNVQHNRDGTYLHCLRITDNLYYTFYASPRIFGNWQIDTMSICRSDKKLITVSDFIKDVYQIIGIDSLTMGHFLREINNTLIADCHILARSISVDNMLNLPNHLLESYLPGHPWFVINKGRLGFSYHDYLCYAPEHAQSQQLRYIAVKRNDAIFNSVEKLDYDYLLSQEISAKDQEKFRLVLERYGVSSNDYYFMPVHEWQWQNHLISLFANDIVKKNIIYLGQGSDAYIPTQSVRTFCNITHHQKYQVKLPISIFNTAVYRGLPGERTRLAPMLSEWLQKKSSIDSFLRNACRLILLGEIASLDFPHKYYEQLPGVPYQYKELLGVIWRENVNYYLKSEEKAITMASLIHVDHDHKPFIKALVEKSGLSLQVWLREFFNVTIPPLLHWLYQYGLVFSPHGENTLLILEENKPVGLVIKDFIDDVNISERPIPERDDLPKALQEVLLQVSDNQITQFIHTGLFVVVYRYFSDILQTYMDYDEVFFWKEVYATIIHYQTSHPELTERFSQFNLLQEKFNKICLNRLRVLSVGYKDHDDRPKVDTIHPMNNPVHPNYFKTWGKRRQHLYD